MTIVRWSEHAPVPRGMWCPCGCRRLVVVFRLICGCDAATTPMLHNPLGSLN